MGHGFSSQPPRRDGFNAPPPHPHDAPPYERYRYRQHQPPTIWEAIRQKLALVVIGVLLFIGGVGVTFWNEGRTVKRSQVLEDGLARVTTLTPSSRDGRIPVSWELAESLVHVTERLSVPKPLSDPYFNLVVHAVQLKRVVEMLQWVEHEHSREIRHEDGQTTTESSYDYTQEWRASLVPSAGFNSPGHRNPDKFPLEGQIFQADQVYVGPFSVAPSLRTKIDWFSTHDLSSLHAHLLPMGSKKVENFIYFGFGTPSRPSIGDWRVSFSVAGVGDPVNAETVSAVAKQTSASGDGVASLTAFETPGGDVIDFVYRGPMTKEQIFSSERKSNLVFSWMMRGAGWLLMFIGILSISDLITSIFSGIPLLRDVVAMTSATLALVVSGASSLVVIAVGWCVYRPFFALCCLAVTATPFVIARCRRT